MPVDFTVLDFIQSHLRTPALDLLMPFISALGNGGAIWLASAAILLLRRKTRAAGAAMLTALALEALLCSGFLKPFVARLRPFEINTGIHLLIQPPSGYSFPSGHAASSFAAAAALFFSGSRLAGPAFVLAALIAFSRLYLYVHFPTDVAAGAMIGFILGWAGAAASRLLSMAYFSICDKKPKKT